MNVFLPRRANNTHRTINICATVNSQGINDCWPSNATHTIHIKHIWISISAFLSQQNPHTHTISIVFLFICIVNLTLSLQHWFSLKNHCLHTVSVMNVWIDCGLWSQGHVEEKQQPPKKQSLRRRKKQWIFYRGSAAEGSVGDSETFMELIKPRSPTEVCARTTDCGSCLSGELLVSSWSSSGLIYPNQRDIILAMKEREKKRLSFWK